MAQQYDPDTVLCDLYRFWPRPSRNEPYPIWWVYPPIPPEGYPKSLAAYNDLKEECRKGGWARG